MMFMKRLFKIPSLLLCIAVCVFSVPACWSASSFPDLYDKNIKSASERYLPGVDWELLKAQYYQESLLDKDAVSPVGAAGIAQFMPATWLEISRELGYENISPHVAKPAIYAGAYYMSKMRAFWSSPRPEMDRHSLAAGSYNAGAGNLSKAQKLCGGDLLYREIVSCLPDVTGRHSKETITYVNRIWSYWLQMKLGVT